jgi:glucose/arabinose dehydrogenase
MTNYEIISTLIALAGLLGAGVAAYIKLRTSLAKVQAEIEDVKTQRIHFQRDIASKADEQLVIQLQSETNSKLDNINTQLNMIYEKMIK